MKIISDFPPLPGQGENQDRGARRDREFLGERRARHRRRLRDRGEEEEAQEGAEGEGLPPDQEGGESGRICGFRGVHRGVDYRQTIDLQRVQDRVP